ncbi:AbrB family transcriptional regulator [Rhodococcus sp. IEGM 1381]|uniref:AbrB family transcriptional regulator n=1 Tax=Rhodococcus sp. IEGM 1381 TaxID=3047085 RepID=UPI0024B867AB|nr:AbrB family transcriptional regulator [Rhodococcus sp. IEGM 1381]MDI9896520.1 AbrB family transcriptional regulator [Rhodococcus sp. IEGM 1381]
MIRWLLLIAVTVGLTVGADSLGVPSAALFVALLVAVIFALAGWAPTTGTERAPLPRRLGMIAQAVLGVEIGTLVQRDTLTSLGDAWIPVVLACVGTLVLSIAAGALLGLRKDIDSLTGSLALVAGGASGLVAITQELGGDERVVAVVQYMRVVLVTTTLPLVSTLVFRAQPGQSTMLADSGAPLYVDLAFVLVCGGVGVLLATALRFPAPALLGPLIIATGADVLGFSFDASVPTLSLWAAYIVIGWQAGLRFTVASLKSISRVLPASLMLIIAVTVGCAMLGLWLASATGTSGYEGYLATTPGGVYAVLAIAASTGANVTFVVAAQVIRVFMMLFAVPVGAKVVQRYRRGRTD